MEIIIVGLVCLGVGIFLGCWLTNHISAVAKDAVSVVSHATTLPSNVTSALPPAVAVAAESAAKQVQDAVTKAITDTSTAVTAAAAKAAAPPAAH